MHQEFISPSVPKKLYGKHTQAAIENFPISGWQMPSEFLMALALIKEHAARVNGSLGVIPKSRAHAIAAAAVLIKKGKYLDQFPVDVFQTGSGTSTNMNMNEVIAGIANEEMSHLSTRPPRRTRSPLRQGYEGQARKVEYIHPNDHVNRCQSSNDVIPSALQISTALYVRDELIPAIAFLIKELSKKEKEFASIIKIGRTHLMDAVPVRMGDEFRAYSALLVQSIESLTYAIEKLCTLPLGGTAVGTGMNAHPQFAKKVIAALKKETQLPLEEAEDHITAQSCPLAFKTLSSAITELALTLTKIAHDIRFMGSDSIAELILPGLQAGSSIMPGKVNPVLCESMEQVSAWVMGAEVTIAQCIAHMSRFELCTGYPVIASTLHTSMMLLTNITQIFAKKCVRGLKANTKLIQHRLERSPMLATALAPEIGYEKAAEIAKEALKTGETIVEVALRSSKIPRARLKKLLNPNRMV